jgi:hypothetical protein
MYDIDVLDIVFLAWLLVWVVVHFGIASFGGLVLNELLL